MIVFFIEKIFVRLVFFEKNLNAEKGRDSDAFFPLGVKCWEKEC